jgi:hypothetical protein
MAKNYHISISHTRKTALTDSRSGALCGMRFKDWIQRQEIMTSFPRIAFAFTGYSGLVSIGSTYQRLFIVKHLEPLSTQKR